MDFLLCMSHIVKLDSNKIGGKLKIRGLGYNPINFAVSIVLLLAFTASDHIPTIVRVHLFVRNTRPLISEVLFT